MPPSKFLASLKGKRKRGEEGEILTSKAAGPQRPNDPPPPEVATSARIPRQVAGFATRSDAGLREVLTSRHSPEPVGRTVSRRRLAGNYEGCTPAVLCVRDLCHSFAVVPVINNLPNPRSGVVMSKDNALAAVQAVATSFQADLDHYVTTTGRFEKEWIERDAKASLARAMVAVEAQQMMHADLEGKADDTRREIRTLKEKGKKLQEEKNALKERVEQDKDTVKGALQRAEAAEKEVARLRAREEEVVKAYEEEKAASTKVREELSTRVKELEEARLGKEPEEEELEKIRVAHWDEWVNSWVRTDEGND